MVWTFEEEMCRCPSEGRCERLDIVDMRRGRGRLKKYQEEVIRQAIASLQLIEDMTLDRTVWRSRIQVESQYIVLRRVSPTNGSSIVFRIFTTGMFLALSFLLLLVASYASIFLLFSYCVCLHYCCVFSFFEPRVFRNEPLYLKRQR